MIQVSDVLPKNAHTIYAPNYAWIWQVFDPLVRYDWRAGFKPIGVLAESFQFGSDALTLTFNLRKGVKFHSGRDFTAEDVRFNLLRVREEKVGSQWRAYSNDIADIQTPDASTVVLTFKEPRPGVFDMFDAMPMIDRESVEDLEAGKRVIGTGPFKWVRWSPNDQLVVARNEAYWQGTQPLLDEIQLRIVPNAQTLAVNVESGAAELALNPSFKDFSRLKSSPGASVASSGVEADCVYLGADLLQPPLDKPKIRQAINWAVDRQRIADSILLGAGGPTSVIWSPKSPAWDAGQANAYTFNLDRAKALLAEAGEAGGFKVNLSIHAPIETLRGMAQIIQSDLATIGIEVTIQELDNTRFLESLTGRKFRGLWLAFFSGGYFHPGSVTSLLFPFRTSGNASNYESPRYSELAQQAASTADPERAKRAYQELTQLLLDESFVMPIVRQPTSWAVSSKVTGLDYNAAAALLLGGTGIEK
jgi:peptide/nickel transport system substrate-binding protein